MISNCVRTAWIDIDHTVLFDYDRGINGCQDLSKMVKVDELCGNDIFASAEVEDAMMRLREKCTVIISTARDFRRTEGVKVLSNYADLLCCRSGAELYVPARSYEDRGPEMFWERSREYDAWLATRCAKSAALWRIQVIKELQAIVRKYPNWFVIESEYSVTLVRSESQVSDARVLEQIKALEERLADVEGIVVIRNSSHIEFIDDGVTKLTPCVFLFDSVVGSDLYKQKFGFERYAFGDDFNDLVHCRAGDTHSGELLNGPFMKGFYYPADSALDELIAGGGIDVSSFGKKFVRGRSGIEFFPDAVNRLLASLEA